MGIKLVEAAREENLNRPLSTKAGHVEMLVLLFMADRARDADRVPVFFGSAELLIEGAFFERVPALLPRTDPASDDAEATRKRLLQRLKRPLAELQRKEFVLRENKGREGKNATYSFLFAAQGLVGGMPRGVLFGSSTTVLSGHDDQEDTSSGSSTTVLPGEGLSVLPEVAPPTPLTEVKPAVATRSKPSRDEGNQTGQDVESGRAAESFPLAPLAVEAMSRWQSAAGWECIVCSKPLPVNDRNWKVCGTQNDAHARARSAPVTDIPIKAA